MILDELRIDISKEQKKGIPFIAASIILWGMIAVVTTLDLPINTPSVILIMSFMLVLFTDPPYINGVSTSNFFFMNFFVNSHIFVISSKSTYASSILSSGSNAIIRLLIDLDSIPFK